MAKEAKQELRELWAERVQDFLASGLSQRAWCRESGFFQQTRAGGFLTWLEKTSAECVQQSHLGKAVSYCLKHWQELNNFLLDGRLELSNNRAERSIKPFVIGRKNFLFCITLAEPEPVPQPTASSNRPRRTEEAAPEHADDLSRPLYFSQPRLSISDIIAEPLKVSRLVRAGRDA